ncbi:MAG: hypothetical protein QOF73_3650, partial [Thermomicrobiales bacterium]|nr:hypothetical protein [Thermomicrobiales bacterium]
MPSLSTSDSPAIHVRSSRRALLGYGLAGAALAAVRPATARATMSSPSPEGWRPWLLTSASELRPTAPAPPSADEIAEVLALQAKRTAATEDLVARWGARSAVLPWTELALELIAAHKPSPVRAGRALALLHTAVFDAVVATWDAKVAHRRAAPSTVDARIVPIGDATAGGSSFPSEHAAVAGTAATVLPSLFPDEPVDRLAALAEEAATSRLWAAACFGSDIDAGLALGRAVGERAVARGEADGSDRVWDGTGRPTGEGYWEPTPPAYLDPPLDPLAGTWQTWVLERGDQLRPAPPPTWGSPVWEAEMGAAREAVASRTAEQEAAVWFWAGTPGTVTPAGLWTEIARDLIVRDGLDLPHAARVLALTSVAMA